jgi:hypothetical protein
VTVCPGWVLALFGRPGTVAYSRGSIIRGRRTGNGWPPPLLSAKIIRRRRRRYWKCRAEWSLEFPCGRQPRWREEGVGDYYAAGPGVLGLFVLYFSGIATQDLPGLNRPPFRCLRSSASPKAFLSWAPFVQPVYLGLRVSRFCFPWLRDRAPLPCLGKGHLPSQDGSIADVLSGHLCNREVGCLFKRWYGSTV